MAEMSAADRPGVRVMYVIELTEAELGGLELVDPSWCKSLIYLLPVDFSCRTRRDGDGDGDRVRHVRCAIGVLRVLDHVAQEQLIRRYLSLTGPTWAGDDDSV